MVANMITLQYNYICINYMYSEVCMIFKHSLTDNTDIICIMLSIYFTHSLNIYIYIYMY